MSKRNILLVGPRAADVDDIKRELGPGYTSWYCSDLSDALESIGAGDFEADIIFLDLALFTTENSKEFFLEIRKAIPDTPVIILSEGTDGAAVQYMMEAGAAGHVSRAELRSDPNSLRKLVMSCYTDRPIPTLRAMRAANDVLKVPTEQAINIRLLPDEPEDPALN